MDNYRKIDNIIKAINGTLVNPSYEFEGLFIEGVSIDSRTIKNEDTFITVNGPNFRGKSFIKNAVNKGAKAIITDTIPEEIASYKIPVIKVQDGYAALLAMAHHIRSSLTNTKFTAITGSHGKTTVKEMLKHIISSQYKTFATKGNLNNHIGVPLNIVNISSDTEHAILELGMSKAGDINFLAAIIKPHAAIITTVAPAHSETAGSIQDIALIKSEIFNHIVPGGPVIINSDPPCGHTLMEKACKLHSYVITFGHNAQADARLLKVKLQDNQVIIIADFFNRILQYKINTPFMHIAIDTLPAILLCSHYKINPTQAIDTIQQFTGLEGRNIMHKISLYNKTIYIIDESYNAAPLSMQKAIENLYAIADDRKGRAILILGDMEGLAQYAEKAYQKLAQIIVKADIVYLKGTQMQQHIMPSLSARNNNGGCFDNAIDAIKSYINTARENDCVLIKGSNIHKMYDAISYIVNLSKINNQIN